MDELLAQPLKRQLFRGGAPLFRLLHQRFFNVWGEVQFHAAVSPCLLVG